MVNLVANDGRKTRVVTITQRADRGLGGFLWRHRWLLRWACAASVLFGMALALWLTLRSSGDLPENAWVPRALERWVNGAGRDRNLPAYFLLGLPLFCLVPTRAMRLGFVGAVFFAAALEVVQLAVPTRTFDVFDVVLSWVGLVFAYLLVRRFKQRVLFRQVKVIRSYASHAVQRSKAGRN